MDHDTSQSAPYSDVPLVNNFVYPPLMPSPSDGPIAIAEIVELARSGGNGVPFTIYVSIPYCRVQCHSCHMFKELLPTRRNQEALLDEYVNCVLKQIDAYASTARFSGSRCGAIYLGGGTASLLTPGQIELLLGRITDSFRTEPDLEITLEGNPTEFSCEYLDKVRTSGVNRISIGYQSAIESTLKALNSPHRSSDGLAAVKNALASGFETVNVDLLFNVPGQTEEQWHQDLYTLLDLGPQGISPGDYIVFPGTSAERLVASGRLREQHDGDTAQCWYRWGRDRLTECGYEELVRGVFAQPGHLYKYVDLSCRQNCEIVGLGAGAYSFIGRYQFRAPDDAEVYKSTILGGQMFHAARISLRATDRNLMERFVIHNFFSSVLSRQYFKSRFGLDPLSVFGEVFSRLEKTGLICVREDTISLTDQGQKWRRNVYYEFRSADFLAE